jgi:hypothetical protein
MEHNTFGLWKFGSISNEDPFSLDFLEIFPLYRERNSGLTGLAIKWKAPPWSPSGFLPSNFSVGASWSSVIIDIFMVFFHPSGITTVGICCETDLVQRSLDHKTGRF